MAAGRSFEEGLNIGAERLCLAFANTVNWHASAEPKEELHDYDDLAKWAQRVGLLDEAETRRLRAAAGAHPAEAKRVLERARQVREAIYHIFSAHAHGRPPAQADVATLNAAVGQAMPHARLVTLADGFRWDWEAPAGALDQMLGPIVKSAVDLLTAPELERVGECADDRGCGWLFLDLTKNHSRRWCAMKDCGNRAKARRHYARRKQV